jgi:hypothetical protein
MKALKAKRMAVLAKARATKPAVKGCATCGGAAANLTMKQTTVVNAKSL